MSMLGCGWSGTGDSGGYGEELSDSIEFQLYMDAHVVSIDDKQWLIEGDIITDDMGRVAEAYRRYEEAFGNVVSDSAFRSTVACDTDLKIDQIWNPSQKLRLTYCFDASWANVPNLYSQTATAMDAATLAWESSADVNFVEVDEGEACSHNSALFVVTYEGDSKKNCLFGQFCPNATAFFPNEPDPSKRYVRIWDTAYQGGGRQTSIGLLLMNWDTRSDCGMSTRDFRKTGRCADYLLLGAMGRREGLQKAILTR